MENITSISAIIAAVSLISGTVYAACRWFARQERQSRELQNIKNENMLIVSALSACLDGLTQLGANHAVTAEKEKLDKYLIEQAHKH